MKRTLALILSLVMCLGLLAGCGDKKTDDGQTDGKTLVVGTCLLYTSPSPRDCS